MCWRWHDQSQMWFQRSFGSVHHNYLLNSTSLLITTFYQYFWSWCWFDLLAGFTNKLLYTRMKRRTSWPTARNTRQKTGPRKPRHRSESQCLKYLQSTYFNCIERSGFVPWPGWGWGRCVVSLGKILNSHSASLHPGVWWVPANLMLGVNLRWTSIPSRGE